MQSPLPQMRANPAVQGRELRGLPVRERALDAIFTPQTMLIGGGLTLLVYLALAGLVLRNKPFFFGPTEYVTEV